MDRYLILKETFYCDRPSFWNYSEADEEIQWVKRGRVAVLFDTGNGCAIALPHAISCSMNIRAVKCELQFYRFTLCYT